MKIRGWLCAALVVCAAGCSLNRSRTQQLQQVAKDWCMTIRASQVLPAYPLTEDLQVGDIFLVSTPIGEETKIFERKGFLPLDNVIARLYPAGFTEFYKGSYGVNDANVVVPHQWQFPNPTRTTAPTTDWSMAPGAAFPSYTFEIKQGAGASLALPVNAVPVGLSLMRTGNATGAINITQSSTYGLPVATLNGQIDDWADQAANRAFLATYAPSTIETKEGGSRQQQNYIRVVQRVYVAGAVNVSLANTESRGGRADAGVAPSQNVLPAPSAAGTASSAATDYQDALTALNKSIASTSVGGTVEIASASNRGISLNETFPRPLVFGYLAFDRAIEEGGFLGPPIPTQARVTKQIINVPAVRFGPDPNTQKIRDWAAKSVANDEQFVSWLRRNNLNPANRGAILSGTKYRDVRQQIVQELGIE